MTHARIARSVALVSAAAAALALVGAGTAGQAFHGAFHDEGARIVEDFCDVAGLTVEIAFVVDGRVHVVPRGADRLEYFLQHGELAEVIANPTNGRFVTTWTNVLEKDLLVTDNGDGTLTALVLATGNAVLYGPDGKAIARDPGQIRFDLLIDETGDTTFLGVVKESTGRSDGFCEAAIEILA